jgi:hypothetical protein
MHIKRRSRVSGDQDIRGQVISGSGNQIAERRHPSTETVLRKKIGIAKDHAP